MYGAISRLASLLAIAKTQRTPDTIPSSRSEAEFYNGDCCSLDIGYSPTAAAEHAQRLSTRSWEYGTAAEAVLELYNPEYSVFSKEAFPNNAAPQPDVQSIPALCYAKKHIELNRPDGTLIDGDGATGDPASLGVSAILIGQTDHQYLDAAQRQFEHLNNSIPRWSNGAMSHREDYAELWADFIYMGPPFLAYFALATEGQIDVIKTAIMQCLLYRQVLKSESGLWHHIIGPKNQDLGLWSTGNGWAAMGMARVLASTIHFGPLKEDKNAEIAQADLFHWIGEILHGAMRVERAENGLLRNYLDDESWFGETSGTSLLAATVYRLAVLQREADELFVQRTKGINGEVVERPVTPELLAWADENRRAVASHVDKNGIASPAVNPLGWGDRTPYTKGSPEGESFLVMLYASWRDCIDAGVCHQNR